MNKFFKKMSVTTALAATVAGCDKPQDAPSAQDSSHVSVVQEQFSSDVNNIIQYCKYFDLNPVCERVDTNAQSQAKEAAENSQWGKSLKNDRDQCLDFYANRTNKNPYEQCAYFAEAMAADPFLQSMEHNVRGKYIQDQLDANDSEMQSLLEKAKEFSKR